MTTVEEWRAFLQKWSEEWLATDETFPAAVRKSRWLGFKPATEKQIDQLEKRLGYRLPPSYRAFLLTTNGWRRTSAFIENVRPANKVQWLEVDDPQTLEAWFGEAGEDAAPFDGVSPEEYFTYDGRPIFDARHFRRSLKVADPVPGDSAIYVLNPEAVADDGEWEAWLHAHWIPGAERQPSFALLMRAEYASFRSTILGDTAAREQAGPFGGVYAPERPRRAAERLGPGKLRPRRLTVKELIDKLEDPSANFRRDAAKQLFREFKPHDPDAERPDWVGPLARILRSAPEPDVRSSAACMLGTYGDRGAIGPLVAALEDPEVAGAAVIALNYLSLYMKEPQIADALCRYLGSPRDITSASTAISILQDFGDRRLVPIALQMLDGDAMPYLRSQAAFAVAALGETAADDLMSRLTHDNPEVRTAAAAALRQVGDVRAIPPLRAALKDSDPNVRIQAATSLRFLGEDVPISPADQAEAEEQLLAKLKAAGINTGGAPPQNP
jgi:HEAT repeat protein